MQCYTSVQSYERFGARSRDACSMKSMQMLQNSRPTSLKSAGSQAGLAACKTLASKREHAWPPRPVTGAAGERSGCPATC